MIYENIVFEGGGVRGLAYIGALRRLNELDKLKYIKKVIGTSIGSIFATITTFACTDDELNECAQILCSGLKTINDGFMTEVKNLVEKMGIHSNLFIYDGINKFLAQKTGINNITFEKLFEETKIELTIVGTCLTSRTTEYFNYKTYPNMEVAKAIQISTAIPIFFNVVEWDNRKWVDGGVVENFPIEYFDEDSGKYNDKTLGLYLLGDCEKKQTYEINNIYDLLNGIENIQLDDNIRQSISKENKRNIIFINTGKISSIDLEISKENQQFLINNGYNCTNEYFAKNENNNFMKNFFMKLFN